MSRAFRNIWPVRLGAVPALLAAPAAPRNTVLHGNCIELMRELPDASVDFILTDPPYVCRYRDSKGRTVANDDNTDWILPAAREMYRVLKPDSFAVSFYGWNAADHFVSAWKKAGFRVGSHMVFVKDYASSSRFLQHHHEMAYVLTKGSPAYPVNRTVSDVQGWAYTGNKLHPTQKPVESLKPLVELFCPKGGLVLDPFAGSGSTLVAAHACGANWLGMELSKEHFETIRHRMGLA